MVTRATKKYWNMTSVTYLKDNYNVLSAQEIADKLGIEKVRVCQMASRIRLKKDKAFTVPQARMLRLLSLIKTLGRIKLTIEEMAAMLDISPRSMYRYVSLLITAGIDIHHYQNRYFIPGERCPLCSK